MALTSRQGHEQMAGVSNKKCTRQRVVQDTSVARRAAALYVKDNQIISNQ